MKKKILVAGLLAVIMAFSFVLVSCGSGPRAGADVLYVYNWGDYIDPDVEKDFENWYKDKTGKEMDMIYSTFDTNETMLTNILKGESKVDLICPSDYAIEKLMAEGKLDKLDKTKISNVGNVDQRIYDKVDSVFTSMESGKMSDYFIPYMWGTLGVLYNTKYVTAEQAEEAGYGLLWNSTKIDALNGKIYMKDSIRDAYVAAVLYLKEEGRLPKGGKDYDAMSIEDLINTVDDTLLAAAETVLKEQKDVLKDYEVDFGKNEMVTEKGYVDLAWSGDALYAMEESEDLDYYVPAIGGNVWFDGWALLKDSENKSAAYLFLEFMCAPEIGMRNAMEIGYTSAIDKDVMMASPHAIKILTDNEYDAEEFFSDEIRYPDIDNASYGVMKDFGSKNDNAVAMWERVKAHGNKTWILIVVIAAVVVVGGGVAAFLIIRNKKGSKRKVVSRPVSKPADAVNKDDSQD